MESCIRGRKIYWSTFIDFKKAFDSISHETLDLELQACGVSGHLHRLIMSYLQSREQYVEINGK